VVRVVSWIRHFVRVALRVVRVVSWIRHFVRVALRVVRVVSSGAPLLDGSPSEAAASRSQPPAAAAF
ncbi:MAG: hypothetical protein ABI112_18645, partial [Terracoccus sp.]